MSVGEPHPLLIAALGAAIALLVVQSVRLWATQSRPRRRLEQNRRAGAEGEILAERLLRERGYEVEARQVGGRYALLVDGAPRQVTLRADFVVRRGQRRFVAEAKGGRVAGRIETIATRRQVLEYCVAFDVEGVLLVDARAGEVSLVQLPRSAGAPTGGWGRVAIALSGTGLLLWALWTVAAQ